MATKLRVRNRDCIDPEVQLRNYAEWLRANQDARAYISGTPKERDTVRGALVRMGISANRIIEVNA